MASRRLEVPKDVPPQLEKFLVKAMPNVDAARARQLLAAGKVRVNGKVAKPGRRLWGGEAVEVELPAPSGVKAVVGPTIEILAETADLVVVNKPSGLVVEPEPNQVSVVELLASQHGGFDVGGAGLPGVVQRLDKDTSGCLAFAKTDDGVALLERGFEEKRIEKHYLAVVHGRPEEKGQLETAYARLPGDSRRYTTRVASARRARLSWTTVETFVDATLLDITLDTGRTHQIRVQGSESGWPVLGDPLYGRPFEQVAVPRLALHAVSLTLSMVDPPIVVRASLPADLEALLAALR